VKAPSAGELRAFAVVHSGRHAVVQAQPRRARLTWRGALHFVLRQWLPLATAGLLVFVTLPVIEPLLRAAGWLAPANAIFAAYSTVCHQMPSRSYFIAGQQLAWCERNTAMYGTMAVCSLAWPGLRRGLPRATPLLFVLLCLPLAVDGFSQLAGLRESTWQLRTMTGVLFGAGCIWFGYPLLARTARFVRLLLLLRQPGRPAAC